jgi:hypothetical protein
MLDNWKHCTPSAKSRLVSLKKVEEFTRVLCSWLQELALRNQCLRWFRFFIKCFVAIVILQLLYGGFPSVDLLSTAMCRERTGLKNRIIHSIFETEEKIWRVRKTIGEVDVSMSKWKQSPTGYWESSKMSWIQSK